MKLSFTSSALPRRLPTRPDKSLGILHYDEDNAYPQRVREILRLSGTGTACVSLYAKFLKGDGLEDERLALAPLDPEGTTANQLLRRLADDLARFGGFAVHVGYDALFRPVSLTHLSFEFVRLGLPGEDGLIREVAVYDDWDRNKYQVLKRKQVELLPLFDADPAIVAAQMKAAGGLDAYQGQVFYYTPEPGSYPLAPFDAVLEDLLTDAEIKAFKYANISTGFLASHLLETPEFEDEAQRELFKKNLRQFQGGRNASKLLHIENPDMERMPMHLHDVKIQDNDSLFQYTESSVQQNIRKAFGIPPVLMGDLVAGKLGTAQEIRDAFLFFNQHTRDERRVLKEALSELLSLLHPAVPSAGAAIRPLDFQTA